MPYPCPSHSWRIASEGQNQLRRDAPAETRRSNSLLRGQATHEHFSIETSAVVTPVRTTVAPSEFLTRINAPSLFSMRRARASVRHQIARSSDSQASARHQIACSSGSLRMSAIAGASPCRTISNVNTGIQHRPFLGNGFPADAVCAEIGPSVIHRCSMMLLFRDPSARDQRPHTKRSEIRKAIAA